MLSKFFNLDTDKQDRILNAAIKEFAQRGFKDASTNEIVKEANISKGLLFHYFSNKKKLFLFLFDYGLELGMKEIYSKIDMDEEDLFIRLRQVSMAKMELLRKHPELIDFFQTAFFEDSNEVKEEIQKRIKANSAMGFSKVLDGIDMSRFKEGIDIQKAVNIITWTFEGFAKAELDKRKLLSPQQVDYTSMFAEGDMYIEILKNCFYK